MIGTARARETEKGDIMPAVAEGKIAMVETGPEVIAPNIRVVSFTMGEALWCKAYSFNYKTGVVEIDNYQSRIFEEKCAPLMKAQGARFEMYALADRSGSKAVNYEITDIRLLSFRFLATECGVRGAFGPEHKSLGEDYAEHRKVKDRSSTFYLRCVLVWIWPNHQSQIRVAQQQSFLVYARSHKKS